MRWLKLPIYFGRLVLFSFRLSKKARRRISLRVEVAQKSSPFRFRTLGKFQQGENHIGRVTSDETNAKQTHSETDCTLGGGENHFTNNNLSITLNDGYLNNKGGIGYRESMASIIISNIIFVQNRKYRYCCR